MNTLISVPPALVGNRNLQAKTSLEGCFITADPEGVKLGSGGGTAHLIHEAWKVDSGRFEEWMLEEKRVVLHAGGQSRRLPAYGPSGKALIPVPIFRWAFGQRIDQTLLDLQLPLLKRMLEAAHVSSRWIIASGDVLVWQEGPLPPIPEADVVCVGLSESVEKVTGHGVFFTPREDATHLKFMLQKPTVEKVGNLASEHLFFIDVGIWILSHRAMMVLMEKSGWSGDVNGFADGIPGTYDLYSDFGLSLGSDAVEDDAAVSQLSCAVLPMNSAEFYHFGRNCDTVGSSLTLQERVNDPTRIHSPLIKPNPAIFIQNSLVDAELRKDSSELWIENSVVGSGWNLEQKHLLTGIPENDWQLDLSAGDCMDVVPVKAGGWAIRLYGFEDAFKGPLEAETTFWMERSFRQWCQQHAVNFVELGLDPRTDLQFADLFPVVDSMADVDSLICWMLAKDASASEDHVRMKQWYLDAKRVSADWLNTHANLEVLFDQRVRFLGKSFPLLLSHADRNIFHQIDLKHAAEMYAEIDASLPVLEPDPKTRLFSYIRDQMFRFMVKRCRGEDAIVHEQKAFGALRNAIVEPYRHCRQRVVPSNTAISDQVIWARSPVRLDLAGGWSDTPPFCMLNGGSVVNIAVELNGQPPIQVFVRVCEQHHIVLRSIDLGVSETLVSYGDIEGYTLGSGFAIPKAALALAGFHPNFQNLDTFPDLKSQLKAFGGGIEISLLCAVPKGSGLGTSSILSATLLGALSDLCGLGWEAFDIANRTLAVEQMLTSGGGWQDQYGGILHGIKHLQTQSGLQQLPDVRWLPDHLFSNPAYKSCMLLYYTGVTRVAKQVLGEIVRGMFLNQRGTLSHLNQIHDHALAMRTIVERGDFEAFGRAIRRSWDLNQGLDVGTNPEEVQTILQPVSDLLLGMKLLGAGGGGYFLMVAKSPEAAARVRSRLETDPPNCRARFVDFSVSQTGLQITRS